MCNICIMLDNSFPYPKELSKALGEVSIDPEHESELELKILNKIVENNQDPDAYFGEFALEFLRRI